MEIGIDISSAIYDGPISYSRIYCRMTILLLWSLSAPYAEFLIRATGVSDTFSLSLAAANFRFYARMFCLLPETPKKYRYALSSAFRNSCKHATVSLSLSHSHGSLVTHRHSREYMHCKLSNTTQVQCVEYPPPHCNTSRHIYLFSNLNPSHHIISHGIPQTP
jgi:hypothetical protein